MKVETRAVTMVADDQQGAINAYAWSPNGGHLAFSLNNVAGVGRIHIWSTADGELRQVTPDHFESGSPAWDPDGDYLFYISDRQYAPQLGSFEWNYLLDRESMERTGFELHSIGKSQVEQIGPVLAPPALLARP